MDNILKLVRKVFDLTGPVLEWVHISLGVLVVSDVKFDWCSCSDFYSECSTVDLVRGAPVSFNVEVLVCKGNTAVYPIGLLSESGVSSNPLDTDSPAGESVIVTDSASQSC